MQAMRNKIADFMETDEALHWLPAFEEQKRETLRSYPSFTWETYLRELRKPRIIWADGLVLLCASLLFGKEIEVVTTKQDGVPTTYTSVKRNIDWSVPYTNPPLRLGSNHDN